MNSPLRKLPAIGLALLMFLPSVLTAPQQPVPVKIYYDYGTVIVVPKPTALLIRHPILPPSSTVRTIRGTNLMFRVAGGIMFDAVGQPCDRLAEKRLSLSYDARRASGKRLVLHVDNRMFSVAGVDDRHLRSIAEFSADENPVVVNATVRAIEGKESCKVPDGMLMVNLHRAFSGTSLGWLLTRMDSMAWSFSEGKRWATKDRLPESRQMLSEQLRDALEADTNGYTQRQYKGVRQLIAAGPAALAVLTPKARDDLKQRVNAISSEAWEKIERDILTKAAINREAFDKLNKMDRRMLLLAGVATGTERVSNINDEQSAPEFCAANSVLAFEGTPRLEFFRTWYDSPHRFQSSSDLMSGNFSQLRLIDPEAYDATMEIYNLSALFRYVKRQQPPAPWKRFVDSLPPKGRGDDIEIACPQCTKDQITQWLACLASSN